MNYTDKNLSSSLMYASTSQKQNSSNYSESDENDHSFDETDITICEAEIAQKPNDTFVKIIGEGDE